MIANGENQLHYLAVKKLPASLRGITSKHHRDLYCLKFPQSFVTEKSLNCKNGCEQKDFCNVIMPFEDIKILKFNEYEKPDKVHFIIYADLECIIEKIESKK